MGHNGDSAFFKTIRSCGCDAMAVVEMIGMRIEYAASISRLFSFGDDESYLLMLDNEVCINSRLNKLLRTRNNAAVELATIGKGSLV